MGASVFIETSSPGDMVSFYWDTIPMPTKPKERLINPWDRHYTLPGIKLAFRASLGPHENWTVGWDNWVLKSKLHAYGKHLNNKTIFIWRLIGKLLDFKIMQKKPKTHQQVLQNIVILKSIYSKMIDWKLIIHLKLGLVVNSMKFSKEILLRTAKRIMLLINGTFNLDTLIHNSKHSAPCSSNYT